MIYVRCRRRSLVGRVEPITRLVTADFVDARINNLVFISKIIVSLAHDIGYMEGANVHGRI